MRGEPLSSVDAAWLHMEQPSNLMMVTGLLMFDEVLEFDRLSATIAERLGRFARFRERVVEPHWPLSGPRWEADPGFDVHAHVHRVALPAPGDHRALQDMVSDLMSTPLDFTKPLWQFHLIEGYGSGCAVLARLHHAIADGIALIGVLLSLTDEAVLENPPKPAPDPPHGWQRLGAMSEALLSPAVEMLKRNLVEGFAEAGLVRSPEAVGKSERTGLAHALVKPAAEAASRAVHAAGTVLHEAMDWGLDWILHPEKALGWVQRAAGGADAVGKLLLMSPDPATAFKGPLGVTKRAAWSGPIALEDVKAVGKALGATVNDVLLAVATGALRCYLATTGVPLYDLEIRAVVPVNLRSPGEALQLGNRFGLVFVSLPVGLEDPLDRLFELKQRMDDIKRSPEAMVAFGLLGAIGMAPTEIEEIVLGIFGARGTAVMTNVPGPREPISLAGRRVRSLMFWVPQSGRLGLGLSLLSYAGEVSIGVATDAGLVPEPERLVGYFESEFSELLELVRREGGLTRPGTTARRRTLRRRAGRRRAGSGLKARRPRVR